MIGLDGSASESGPVVAGVRVLLYESEHNYFHITEMNHNHNDSKTKHCLEAEN
jgi:hypothetical protein